MTKAIKSAWNKTEGYKTVGSGIILLLWEAFTMAFPNLISDNWEEWGTRTLTFCVGVGIFDKIWRNRDKFKGFFNVIFSKKVKK
jgi:hypothetical protein